MLKPPKAKKFKREEKPEEAGDATAVNLSVSVFSSKVDVVDFECPRV